MAVMKLYYMRVKGAELSNETDYLSRLLGASVASALVKENTSRRVPAFILD